MPLNISLPKLQTSINHWHKGNSGPAAVPHWSAQATRVADTPSIIPPGCTDPMGVDFWALNLQYILHMKHPGFFFSLWASHISFVMGFVPTHPIFLDIYVIHIYIYIYKYHIYIYYIYMWYTYIYIYMEKNGWIWINWTSLGPGMTAFFFGAHLLWRPLKAYFSHPSCCNYTSRENSYPPWN